MTTLDTGVFALSTPVTTTKSETPTMLARIFALFSAAGKAVPFHRESAWNLAGSTNFTDRDSQRAQAELFAITSMREHG